MYVYEFNFLSQAYCLNETQQPIQGLKDVGPPAGRVLDLAAPQRLSVGLTQARLPPDADDEGVAVGGRGDALA